MKRWATTLFLVCASAVLVPVNFYIHPVRISPLVVHAAGGTTVQPPANPQETLDSTGNPPDQTATACGSWSAEGIACSIAKALFKGVFAILVSLTGSFMWVGGTVLDATIQVFVVNFGGWFANSQLLTGVQLVWGTIRDIGNIVLIGMFIFIALRTILSIGGSSNKQLVINIIIVALLMNFSLFFVKAALDVTNFFAYQFYKSMTTITEVNSDGTQTSYQATISQRFATASGVGKMHEQGGSALFNRLANDGQVGREDGWGIMTIIINGTMLSILFLATGFVFFYGAFLLLIRGVMLLILMVTSAAAFTTYVLPSPQVRKFFDQWFDALVQNALFGPLLIILLWASIMLTNSLVSTGTGAATGGNLTLMLNYLVVIGLMYGSIKIAGTVAGKTAGIGMASKGFMSGGTVFGRVAGGAAQLNRVRQERSATRAIEKAQADKSSATNTADYLDADKRLASARKRLESIGTGRIAKSLEKVGVKGAALKGGELLKAFEKKQKDQAKEIKDAVATARTIKAADAAGKEKRVNDEKETKTSQQHEADKSTLGSLESAANAVKQKLDGANAKQDADKADLARAERARDNAQKALETAPAAEKQGLENTITGANAQIERIRNELVESSKAQTAAQTEHTAYLSSEDGKKFTEVKARVVAREKELADRAAAEKVRAADASLLAQVLDHKKAQDAGLFGSKKNDYSEATSGNEKVVFDKGVTSLGKDKAGIEEEQRLERQTRKDMLDEQRLEQNTQRKEAEAEKKNNPPEKTPSNSAAPAAKPTGGDHH